MPVDLIEPLFRIPAHGFLAVEIGMTVLGAMFTIVFVGLSLPRAGYGTIIFTLKILTLSINILVVSIPRYAIGAIMFQRLARRHLKVANHTAAIAPIFLTVLNMVGLCIEGASPRR